MTTIQTIINLYNNGYFQSIDNELGLKRKAVVIKTILDYDNYRKSLVEHIEDKFNVLIDTNHEGDIVGYCLGEKQHEIHAREIIENERP